MKTSALITLIVVILIFGITLFTLLRTETGKEIPGTSAGANENTPKINEIPLPQPSQTYNVEMINHAYSPKVLIIKKGDTVIWTNNDKTTTHTVTSTGGKELSSKFLKYEENYTHTFDKEGNFFYYCIAQASEHGEVIVE